MRACDWVGGQFNLGTLMPEELLLREGEVTIYSVERTGREAAIFIVYSKFHGLGSKPYPVFGQPLTST